MDSDCSWTLKDFVSLQRGTTYKGNLLGLPGPLLLGLASIQPNGGFRRGSFKTYGGDSPEKITLDPGEIYVSLKDVTQSSDLLGSVARVPADIQKGRLTQDTVKLVFDGRPISASYIYWLLRTPEYREYCRARGTGTTTLGLAREDFLGFPVPQPTEVRASLVILLEALETRIELLEETNNTLESIAQALFKSWFVDFDPVYAKAEGLEPVGMDADTAALFPDNFQESELGVVPKGWRVGSILDIANLISGGTPKTDCAEYWGGGIPWASAKDVSQASNSILTETGRTITSLGLQKSSTKMIPAYSSVVVARGATTGRMVMFGKAMAMNQTCYALESKAGTPIALYLVLSKEIEALTQKAHGSIFDTITTSTFAASKTLLIPNTLLACFEDIASPLFHRILVGTQKAQTLTQLRDTLLPRLISGQLRLTEAEELVEEACA